MKVKLFKALKIKNRLASELQKEKSIAQRENSWDTSRPSVLDHDKVWNNIDCLTEKLIAVKTAIAKANIGIYHNIETMSELKGQISELRALDVKRGAYKESSGGWGDKTTVERHFQCYLGQGRVDEITSSLQSRIDSLQDEIDEYNATTDVEIPD
jgi:hypothetical protein